MRLRSKLTYANVVATLALFFALSGSVYAANQLKVRSGNIAARAVKAGKIAPGAVKRGKLAPGAVGSDQIAEGAVIRGKIAPGAVGRAQIGDGAVGGGQIEDKSIEPADMKEPVGFVAGASGGSASVEGATGEPYPLQGGAWVARAGEFDVVFGQIEATLQAGQNGNCGVEVHLYVNGQQAGGAWLESGSSAPESVKTGIGGEPRINFESPTEQTLTVSLTSYNCAPGSRVDSARIRVLGIG